MENWERPVAPGEKTVAQNITSYYEGERSRRQRAKDEGSKLYRDNYDAIFRSGN